MIWFIGTQIINDFKKNEISNIDTFDCIAEDVFGPYGEMYFILNF